ncbi:MAG: hypothetical protein ABMA00_13140 [Gemmatimonas sp.]
MNPDGSIATVQGETPGRQELRALRRNPLLRRMPCPDTDIASFAVAHFYTNQNIVVLSSDTGEERNGLRALFGRDVGEVIDNETSGLGLTLIVQAGATREVEFIEGVIAEFRRSVWETGFRELVI